MNPESRSKLKEDAMPEDVEPTCTGICRCGPCNDCVPKEKEEHRGSRMPEGVEPIPPMVEVEDDRD